MGIIQKLKNLDTFSLLMLLFAGSQIMVFVLNILYDNGIDLITPLKNNFYIITLCAQLLIICSITFIIFILLQISLKNENKI